MAVTTVVISLPTASYAQDPLNNTDRPALMKKAQAALDAKNGTEAEKLYGQAIFLDPKDGTAWLQRGYIRAQNKNYDGAIADASSALVAIGLTPTPTPRLRAIAYTNRADSWNQKGEPLRALIDTVIACQVDDKFAIAWLVRADAQYNLGNFSQATICLQKAKALDPKIVRSYSEEIAKSNALNHKVLDDKFDSVAPFAAAYQADKDGDTATAITGYTNILEVSPFVTNAWGNRGSQHFKAGRYTDALADFSTAITVAGINKQPEDLARLLVNRANVYTKQGRLTEGINDLEFAIVVKPDYARATTALKLAQEQIASLPSEALPVLERVKIFLERAKAFKGDIFERNTDADTALMLLDKLNKDEPNNAEGWYLRGVAEENKSGYKIGPCIEAVPFYDKAILLDPKRGDAYYNRGNILLSTYSFDPQKEEEIKINHQKGSADLDKAIDLGVEDANLFAKRASSRSEAKNYSGARSDLNKAIQMEPKNEKFLSSRANILEVLKEWREAIKDRTTLLEIKPDSNNYVSRANDYIELKDWAGAISDFDRAIRLRPTEADFYIDRAKGYRVKGDKAKALADYNKAHEIDSDYPVVSADLSDYAPAEALRHDMKHLLKAITKANNAVIESMGEVTRAKQREEQTQKRLRRLLVGDTRTDAETLKEVDDDIAAQIDDNETYTDRAIIYLKQEKPDLALADATKALTFKKNDALAFDLRGRAHELKKEYDAAFNDYDAAVKAEKRARYLSDRGDMYYQRKDFTNALADYTEAERADPSRADYAFHTGNAQFMLGKYDDAIAAYDRALKIKPDFKEATNNRAVAVKKKAGG